MVWLSFAMDIVLLLLLAMCVGVFISSLSAGLVMKIKSLALQNFRNFTLKSFSFDHTTLLYGANGIGKTSILEAIFVLASAGSFRALKVEEMIRLEAELGRVQGLIDLEGAQSADSHLQLTDEDAETSVSEELKLEIMLTRGEVGGRRTQYRLFTVNDVRRRKQDFLSFFKAVAFRPEDLRLVEGSPSRRRDFLDTALSMVSMEYAAALSKYQQILKRRNRLLQRIHEGQESVEALGFWNVNLVKNALIIQSHRERFIDFVREVVFPFALNISYEPSWLTEARQAEYLNKELIVGHSLIGPHKDDFTLLFSEEHKGIRDLSLLSYGSRGQQRLGVLWLKVAELQFLTDKIGYQPVLLLDDVLSELDETSQDMVLSLLDNYQSILSTADRDVLIMLQKKLPKLTVLEL